MSKIQTLSDDTKSYKPKYEMQDIFKLYGDDYIARNKLNSMQLKAIQDISTCRTLYYPNKSRQHFQIPYSPLTCNFMKQLLHFQYSSHHLFVNSPSKHLLVFYSSVFHEIFYNCRSPYNPIHPLLVP